MDKNLLLAVGLSVAVYALWFGVIEKPAKVPVGAAAAVQTPGAAPSSAAGADVSTQQPEEAQRQDLLSHADAAQFGTAKILISAHGAAIVSYKATEPLGMVELVPDPVPGFFSTWPNLTFKKLDRGPRIVYQASRPDGLRIVKEFIAGDQDQLSRINIELTNTSRANLESGAWAISIGPGLATIASEEKDNLKLQRSLALLKGENGLEGKVESFKPGDHQGDYRWAGVDNRYFLAAIVPPAGVSTLQSRLPAQTILDLPSVALKPGESRTVEIPFYFGAKGHQWLAHYNAGLERAVDFGFFAQLGRFTLGVLTRIQSRTHNWGWSIIVLTMLIQAMLFPLTYKSLKAMNAMKRLQPEIAKLQQRYSKDPTRLNSEMMELYKKHGANPLSGCLPLVVQTPIFYALYTALRNAWELHGSAWIFWIHDLSAKDPYYILPVVMGGVMFAQNKMNPAQGDPSQAQVMMWMPVIFTFMFLKFPAGLVLYWLVNNILTVSEQYIIMRLEERRAAAHQLKAS
jgi:YidC/Oxa1 family membrane protein insertase